MKRACIKGSLWKGEGVCVCVCVEESWIGARAQ